MNTVVTLLLYTQGIIAFILMCVTALREDTDIRENGIIITHMFMVFIWNISYVVMINSADENENLRYVCRSVIMLAVIFSVIFCHYIQMYCLSVRKKIAKVIIATEIMTGLVVYPIIGAREAIGFKKTGFGWSYHFRSYAGRYIYNVYIASIFLLVFIMGLYGFFLGKRKRDRVFGGYSLLCVVIMGAGMITDTILPMYHRELFPGSACAMFVCVMIIYVLSVKRSVLRLTVSNVSPHIFNTIDMPMLILDENNNISIVNKAAQMFFDRNSEKIVNRGISEFFDVPAEDKDKAPTNQMMDVKCLTNQADCRLQFSVVNDGYNEPLGSILMITDMTDKIGMIAELEMYRNHLQEKLDEKTKELEEVILQAISAVANTIDAKDEYTKGHSIRVAQYSSILAKELGKDDAYINNLKHMALLHDIGKIGVPDSVLNKAGKLSDTEFDLIKNHTSIGAEILKDITMVEGVALGAKYHHERYDGKGYPAGLIGEQIPYEARVIGIADAYDAMTSNRIYRAKLPHTVVLQELEKGKGTQFDPILVEAFIKLVKEGKMLAKENETTQTLVGESNQLLVNILEKQNEQNKMEVDYDYLTKLYNRKACEREISKSLLECTGVLMIVDLDHFKNVNDTYGHLMGDYALKVASKCMVEAAPKDSIVGRQGGDEFVIFMKHITNKEEAIRLANQIRTHFLDVVEHEEVIKGCSFSIGLSMPGTAEQGYAGMFPQADKALYHVKQTGRNNVYMYNLADDMDNVTVVHRDIEQIKDMFKNSEKYTGAYFVKMQELIPIYEFTRNFANRYHYNIQIVLFTLEYSKKSENGLEIIEEGMYFLHTSIQQSLRTVDVSTRYGSTQMIVLLLDTDESGVKVATNKIIQNFYKMNSIAGLQVYYDHVDVKKLS